jgi:hypothetical protein
MAALPVVASKKGISMKPYPYSVEFFCQPDIPIQRFRKGFGLVHADDFEEIFSDTIILYFRTYERYANGLKVARLYEDENVLVILRP